MRITPDLLHRFARQAVNQQKRSQPDLHAAYLAGSVLTQDPLLGGSTDIDMVLVHRFQVNVACETIPVIPEISLDIRHHHMDDYSQHRQLRHDPWLGYPLTFNHILLLDSDHWLEFIQAGVSAGFHRSDTILVRVRNLLKGARDNWFNLMQEPTVDMHNWTKLYLETLDLTSQSAAGLIGPPLTRRRFITDFRQRLAEIDSLEILDSLLSLLGFSSEYPKELSSWIQSFEKEMVSLSSGDHVPVHLAPCRHTYYLKALRHLSTSEHPEDSLWPLLRTWLDLHLIKPAGSNQTGDFRGFLESLGLTNENRQNKIAALDAFLDQTDTKIEDWESRYG